MHTFPDFDKDVRRPFAVHEDCYDCAEFYFGCNARPSNPPTRCKDYLRLPDVMPGTYGQVFPPSRMGDRKEPRLCWTTAKDKPEPTEKVRATRPSKQTLTPSPAASCGLAGERLCGCGAALPKRRRCCDDCRRQRRDPTMSRRRSRKGLPVAVETDSIVAVALSGSPPNGAGSRAHSYSGQRYSSLFLSQLLY
jgi:hypothetical protein